MIWIISIFILGKRPGFAWEIQSCLWTIIYVNYIFFLTKTFLGTYTDHLEFTVSPAYIWLFFKNHKRHLSSVCTKSFLGSIPKRRKYILKISLKMKSREYVNTIDHLDSYCISRGYLNFPQDHRRYLGSVCTKIFLGPNLKS